MKYLQNTLFVTSEDIYLSLNGENVVATKEGKTVARYPLHTLCGIVMFSYSGASPALMGACAERNIGLSFCTPNGRFLARTAGVTNGNVLLRRTQFRLADDECRSCEIAKNMIAGKLYNSRWVLERALRDHAERINETEVRNSISIILGQLELVKDAVDLNSLRGYEGVAASAYFASFDQLILRNKESFYFKARSRRPPLDNVNAMLSFAYGLLENDCSNALESVGLDSYVGFLHRDRPGRESLALDLMEEFRPVIADRFVISVVNNRVLQKDDFIKDEHGAVLFTDQGRKQFIKTWQEKKREELTHPFLKEKISWGLLPYVQALLLSRFLRGDLDGYPVFLWK